MCTRGRRVEVSEAVSRCPFLHAVKEFQGEECANYLAVNPFQNAQKSRSKPILPEDPAGSVAAVFKLFHGRNGPIPLSQNSQTSAPRPSGKCPMHSTRPAAEVVGEPEAPLMPSHPLMASISLRGFKFMPDPGDMFGRNHQRRKPNQQQRKPQDPGAKPKQQPSSNSSNTGPPNAASTAGPTTSNPNLNHSKPTNAHNKPSRPSNLSRFGPLGGLLPLAASGKLSCPPAIVAMRAAVAGLKPVRQLRPQALPIRSLATAGTAIMANVPCGMWREHTEKLSPQWFVAVHATIPFVAMLRKAVLMPRWAILLTIAGSLAGQQAGARIERMRLKQVAELRSKKDCRREVMVNSSKNGFVIPFGNTRVGVAS